MERDQSILIKSQGMVFNSAKCYCRVFQWLLFINKQRNPTTHTTNKEEFFWLQNMQNSSSWYEQLQNKISYLMQILSSNTSTVPNSIPTSILKKIDSEISILLSILLKTESFPTYLNLQKWSQYSKMDLGYPVIALDQSLICPA